MFCVGIRHPCGRGMVCISAHRRRRFKGATGIFENPSQVSHRIAGYFVISAYLWGSSSQESVFATETWLDVRDAMQKRIGEANLAHGQLLILPWSESAPCHPVPHFGL